MYLAHRWNNRNLSKIELLAAIILIAILFSMFSIYGMKIVANTEKTAVYTTVNNINLALTNQAIQAIINDDLEVLLQIQKSNPYLLLSYPVFNSLDHEKYVYNQKANLNIASNTNINAGEFDSESLNSIVKGNWYFDPIKKELYYFVKNTEFFNSDLNGIERIRYQIVIGYIDINNNQKYDFEVDKFESIKLESKDNYIWNVY
jgi:type II secretory pathway pseudopilin PulG